MAPVAVEGILQGRVDLLRRRHGHILEDVLPGLFISPENGLAVGVEGKPRAVVIVGKDPQDDDVGAECLPVPLVFQHHLVDPVAAHAHVEDLRRPLALEDLLQVVREVLILSHLDAPGEAVAQRDDPEHPGRFGARLARPPDARGRDLVVPAELRVVVGVVPGILRGMLLEEDVLKVGVGDLRDGLDPLVELRLMGGRHPAGRPPVPRQRVRSR